MQTDDLKMRELDACRLCGKQRPPQNRQYCSGECYHKATWRLTTCHHCQKQFEARIQHLERGRMRFCSEACSQMAARKNTTIEYKGETYHETHGYLVCVKTGMRLHRVVWEEDFGPIPDGYVIHHKDENKSNNALSNLELMEWGKHTAMHHTGKSKKTLCNQKN